MLTLARLAASMTPRNRRCDGGRNGEAFREEHQALASGQLRQRVDDRRTGRWSSSSPAGRAPWARSRESCRSICASCASPAARAARRPRPAPAAPAALLPRRSPTPPAARHWCRCCCCSGLLNAGEPRVAMLLERLAHRAALRVKGTTASARDRRRRCRCSSASLPLPR